MTKLISYIKDKTLKRQRLILGTSMIRKWKNTTFYTKTLQKETELMGGIAISTELEKLVETFLGSSYGSSNGIAGRHLVIV